jgi:hypothetical protein
LFLKKTELDQSKHYVDSFFEMNDRKDKSKIEIKGTRTKPHNKERQSTQQYMFIIIVLKEDRT